MFLCDNSVTGVSHSCKKLANQNEAHAYELFLFFMPPQWKHKVQLYELKPDSFQILNTASVCSQLCDSLRKTKRYDFGDTHSVVSPKSRCTSVNVF